MCSYAQVGLEEGLKATIELNHEHPHLSIYLSDGIKFLLFVPTAVWLAWHMTQPPVQLGPHNNKQKVVYISGAQTAVRYCFG